MMQRRMKSKVLWVSLIALLGMGLKHFYNIDMQEYNNATDLLLSILIGFGIINNPTRNDKL